MESHVVNILLLMIAVTVTSVSSQVCPPRCSCTSYSITCRGLSSFPILLGTTQRSITITESGLPEIPPNAFPSNMRSITISKASIGSIRNCAFKGLREANYISIYSSMIDSIQSGAFSNFTYGTEAKTSISEVRIDVIEPYAFASLVSDKSFSITKANMTTIKPFAFHNLTLKTFSIESANIQNLESSAFSNFSKVRQVNFYSSNIAKLDCDTLNKLYVNASNGVNINRLGLYCDCNIAWLLLTNITFQPSVTCTGPPALFDRSVRDLNVTVVCPSGNFSRTCPQQNEPLPGPCSSDVTSTTPGQTVSPSSAVVAAMPELKGVLLVTLHMFFTSIIVIL